MGASCEGNVYISSGMGATWVGGGETARIEWSKALQRANRSVNWLVPSYTQEIDGGGEVPIGVNIKPVDSFRGKFGKRLIKPESLYDILDTIKNENPDAIILNGVSVYDIPLVMGLVGMGKGTSVVEVHHSDPNLAAIKRVGYKGAIAKCVVNLRIGVSKLLERSGGRMIAMSNFVSDKMKEVGLKNPIVVYPPMREEIDCPSVRVGDKRKVDGNVRILTVSRISPEKGLNLLEQTARKSKRLGFPLSFHLVGGTVFDGELKKIINPMIDVVEFKGQKSGRELCEEYGRNDIMLMPSPNEAFGLVVTEAMQHGMPVIAGYKAAREIFGKADNTTPGLMLSDTNGETVVNDIIEFALRVSNDPDLLASCSVAALGVAEHFNTRKLSDQFVNTVLS